MLKYLILLLIFPYICLSQVSEIPNQEAIDIKKTDSLRELIQSEFFKRNYDKTIEYGEIARKLAIKRNHFIKYYKISSFLGNAYLQINDSLRAKSIFKEAIGFAKVQKDTIGLLASEIDFANFYALQENDESKLKAIELYKAIIPLAKEINSETRLQVLNSNIAELYLDLEKPDIAGFYVNETSKYMNENSFIGFIGSANLNKGRLLSQKGKFNEANKNLNKSLEIFKSIDYPDGQIDAFHYLIENTVKKKDYKEAYLLQKELDKLELKKYEIDKLEAIQTVTSRFKLDEIEKLLQDEKVLSEIKAENAKQEASIFWIKIASGILLLFSLILLYSYLKRKRLLANLIIKNKQYLDEKERSEELSKAKSLLFSNITHELRTPMYGIIGISNILLNEKQYKNDSTHLKSLRFSAEYLLNLVNNILQFNQFENSEKNIAKNEKIKVRNLINNIIESSKLLSEQNPNKYLVLIEEDIPNTLIGDKATLAQILINLIGNASKFTNDGLIKVILKKIKEEDDTLLVSFLIKDNGPGISPQEKKYLFDRLKPSSQSQDFMGTGLGLPIVKKLLDEKGSKLNIISETDKGTAINFELEFKKENLPLKKALNEIKRAPVSLEEYRILVVDDNKINQIVTKKFIERYGADVLTVGSGAESITFLKENNDIDLVLMDINMPEMNGFEATAAIRQFNTSIPILALTAVEKEKVVGDHSFNLMNGVIIKPYSIESFLSIITKHLNSISKPI